MTASDFDLVLGVVERMGDTDEDFTEVTEAEHQAIEREKQRFGEVRRLGHQVELSPRLARLFGVAPE